MGNINPIIKAQMEDIEQVVNADELTPDEQYEYDMALKEANQDLSVVENTEDRLDEVVEAEEKIQGVEAVQAQNIQVIEEPLPEGETFQPVEGGLQEPLPEDENAAVGVITNQMLNEQMVVENIAGLLGCRTDRESTGTQKLYKALGIRQSPYSPRDVHTESFGARNKRVKAISLYKSHHEGIGEVLSRITQATLDGLKKLINAVSDFLKNLSKNAGILNKTLDILSNKFDDVKKNKDKYTIDPRAINGLTELNGVNMTLACSNHIVLEKNIITAITYASTLTEKVEKLLEVVDGEVVNQLVGEIDSLDETLLFQPLEFKGAVLLGSNTSGLIDGDGVSFYVGGKVDKNQAKEVRVEFSSVDDIVLKGEQLLSMDKSALKGFLSDCNNYVNRLTMLMKMMEANKGSQTAEMIKLRMINAIKLLYIGYSNVVNVIQGLEVLLLMVKK